MSFQSAEVHRQRQCYSVNVELSVCVQQQITGAALRGEVWRPAGAKHNEQTHTFTNVKTHKEDESSAEEEDGCSSHLAFVFFCVCF